MGHSKTLLLSIICLVSSTSNAQNYFRKYVGGAMDEESTHIALTPDGNYVLSGMTMSYGSGNADAYLVKIDPSGNILWSKTYGNGDDDFAEWIEPTTDHGFAICGYTFSQPNQDSRIFIIKTDSTGAIEWQKQIKITTVARAYCIRETNDGGFILAGEEDSTGLDGNLLLVKLDALGNTEWSKSYGIPLNADLGQYIEETNDHGFIVCGMSRYGFNSSYALLLKTDSAGNQEWSKTYYDQIPANSKIYPNKIQQLYDGSYIVSGRSFQIGFPVSEILLIKTDTIGNIIWSNLYSTGNEEGCSDLLLNENNSGFYACGYSLDPITGNRNALIMKTDLQGVLKWNNMYGNDTLDGSFDAMAPMPNGYVLVGTSYTYGLGQEDMNIMNTDTAGLAPTCALHQANFTTNSFPLINNGSLNSFLLSVFPANQNFISSSGVQTFDFCQTTGITHVSPLASITFTYTNSDKTLHVANTANETIYNIKISDMSGKTVFENTIKTSETLIDFQLPDLSSGIFFLNLLSGSGKLNGKFIID